MDKLALQYVEMVKWLEFKFVTQCQDVVQIVVRWMDGYATQM